MTGRITGNSMGLTLLKWLLLAAQDGVVSLFDGKTLNGWFIVNQMGPGFVVRDGTSAPSTIDPLAP